MKEILWEWRKKEKIAGPQPFIYWNQTPNEYCSALQEPFPNREPCPRNPQGLGIIQGTLPWHQGW